MQQQQQQQQQHQQSLLPQPFRENEILHDTIPTETLDEKTPSQFQATASQAALLRQHVGDISSLGGEVVTMEQAEDYNSYYCNHASSGVKSNESAIQTEKTNLIQKLCTLRQHRQHIQQKKISALCKITNEWDFRLSSAQQSCQNAQSALEAMRAKRTCAEEKYQSSCKWHVLGDVFFIWYRGPFGTINGFRMGKSATTMAGLFRKCAGSHVGVGGLDTGNVANSGADGNGSTLSSHSTLKNINMSSSINSYASSKDSTLENIIVPWTEINSALGQVVFLLYTLQHTPYSGVSFRRHILQPCGSASKIGVLKKSSLPNSASKSPLTHNHRNERRRITALAAYYNNGIQPTTESSVPTPLPGEVTWYNLHHYEEKGSLLSMGYYARRNFNTALEGLLYCIAEACSVAEKRDMALAAPYTMRVGGLVVGKDVHGYEGISVAKDEGASVGGLPLAYDPAAGEEWTLVCKYLLSNLKWVVTYMAKHVDR